MTQSSTLHPRNRHHGSYDFSRLVNVLPQLKPYVKRNPKGQMTIDFADPVAVKLLNRALLKLHYEIDYWDIPDGFLCPPIPGRADYVHRLADLYSQSQGKKNKAKTLLDIGTGANCIYPIIAASQYYWQVVATDVSEQSLANAQSIVDRNRVLTDRIELRQQQDSESIFKGIIQPSDLFDLTMCNPPFHRSQQEAEQGTTRKNRNLANHKRAGTVKRAKLSEKPAQLNFGGKSNELWCEGGELAFVRKMARESKEFAPQVLWFSTLISKSENVHPLKKLLNELEAQQVKVVEMRQGQKVSRFVAWTFQNEVQRKLWNEKPC